MRGALPGSILILVATILLALVTASVPVIKSIAFLTAKIGGSGSEKGETLTLGTLGYCLGTTCAGPTIGYSFDPTQALGIATSVEGINVNSSKYSTALIKGLTYTLVLHPIALAACVLTLITGLLANCGDLSLKCLNSLFSGLASSITLIAVGCDFALFIIAQKRINDIQGASASLGNALWMTLIAWICIFVSSFFFCCGSSGRGGSGNSRKRNKNNDEYDDNAWRGGRPTNGYADQMRMDALDAESQRKNQNALPKFATYETEHIESVPLKHDYKDQMGQAATPGGYANIGNGAAIAGGHGYGNEYGYSDGGYANYTPGSEHAPYGGYPMAGAGLMASHPMESYIPGVGPGAQRAVAPAAVYHDGSQYHDGQQGGGGGGGGYAHEGPSTYPDYHEDDSMHSYGATPVRSPSWASHMTGGVQDENGYGMDSIPPVPAIPTHIQQQSNYREPSASEKGQSVDYNGATFGQRSTSPSPYEAIQQATSAGHRARALPGAPHSDDGFGLAALQAGQAAAAIHSSQDTSPTELHSPRSRALPSAPSQSQHDPPDYETDYAYGGTETHYSQGYHREGR